MTESYPAVPRRQRDVLTANRTYYVRTDGSDSNTGLADTSGGAFLTIQKALNVVLGTLDLGGFNVTIQCATGTYSADVSFASAQVGAGNITLQGDTTTPSNVTLSGRLTVDGAGCRLFLAGMNLNKGTGSWCVIVKNGGYLKTTGKNRFSSTSGGHRIGTDNGGIIEAVAAEEVEGTVAGGHYLCGSNCIIWCQGATWTTSGGATQGVFAQAALGGVIFAFGNSSSGTFTGSRYNASMNAKITTNGGGASYFPGSAVGATATGGQYA